MTKLELLKLDYTNIEASPTSTSPRQNSALASRSKETDQNFRSLLASSPFTHRLDLRVFGNVPVLNGYVGAPLVGLQEISSPEIIQALELMQVSNKFFIITSDVKHLFVLYLICSEALFESASIL